MLYLGAEQIYLDQHDHLISIDQQNVFQSYEDGAQRSQRLLAIYLWGMQVDDSGVP